MQIKEWYNWPAAQRQKAKDMLEAINANPIFPIVGVRASDGVPQPDKCGGERWADAEVEFEDGSFGFPRPPAEVLDQFGVEQSVRDAMLAAHNPNIVAKENLPNRKDNSPE